MKQAILIASLIYTLFPSAVRGQKPMIRRIYKAGDSYRYKLTCTESYNKAWQSTIISVCELTVVQDSNGVYSDEVRWLSKQLFTKKDTTEQNTAAVSVKPYRISLQEGGRLDMPKVEVPEMTQPIFDFNTFFVAISPHLGATQLNSVGDSVVKKDHVTGDFANGDFILKGQDCFFVKLKLTGATKKQVMSRVDFLPPPEPCLSYLTEEMKVPVADSTINNFQMVMPAGKEKFNVQYGREIFYIESVTGRKDGKLLNAAMNNTLTLRLKLNCDKDYKNCQPDIPFSIERDLKLELLTDR